MILLLAGCLIVPDDECIRAENRGDPDPAHCEWWGWDSGWDGWDTGEAAWSGGDFTPGQVCLSWQLDLVEGALSGHNGGSQSYLRITLAPDGWVMPGAPDLEQTCTVVGYISDLTASEELEGWAVGTAEVPQSYGICETMSSDPFAVLDGVWRLAVAAPDEVLVAETAEDDGEIVGLFSGLSAPPWGVLEATGVGHVVDINLGGEPVALPEDGPLPTGRYVTTPRSCLPWPGG